MVSYCRPRSLRKLILLILISCTFLFTLILYARNGISSGNFSGKKFFSKAPMLSGNSIFSERNRTFGPHPFYLPFNYTILEEKICESPLDFLIVVHSAVGNFVKRKAYRETFSNRKWEKRYNFRTVYAVARAKDQETEERVREESEKYHDIIQTDFVDAYTNLTIKNMMWLRYVRDYCPKVKYILKIDDDIVVNLFKFVDELHGKNLTIPRSICCTWCIGSRIIREPTKQWYVSREDLPGEVYKPYCKGPAYFLTADLVEDLIRQTETHKHYVSVDDAFIFGTIASEINVTRNDYCNGRLNTVPYVTEELMTEKSRWHEAIEKLMPKIWYGIYRNVNSFKRIWDGLVEMYGQG